MIRRQNILGNAIEPQHVQLSYGAEIALIAITKTRVIYRYSIYIYYETVYLHICIHDAYVLVWSESWITTRNEAEEILPPPSREG